ncbi:MAG: cadherin repeat domain-containing protein [Candidatus Thiodiazotropha lotti]|nr:cadherin repeat domain-containing protein [Candidatus Thiodiazotropha lotti]MCW4221805.1 cadherin repeat domain-containing protein [Candidatus Thiodiazotropha lotti]
MPVIRIDADDVYTGRNSDYIHVNAIRRTGTWELTNDYRLAGRFPISAIPAGSTINQVDVELTAETPGNTTELHHILPYNGDGSGDAITDTGQTFYDRCGIVANSYATTAFPAAGLMTVSDLGAQANADIQARIGSTFNVALRQVTEATTAFTGTALDGATVMMTLVIDYTESGGGTDPVITDVNTDENVELGSAGNVITGTDFEATQGTGQVRINTQSDGLGTDLAVTETVWNDTSITFTVPVGLPPGAAYLFVQNDSGSENATGFAITLTVPTGYESFTYDGTTVPEPSETIQEMALADFTLTMANGDITIIETTTAVWSTDGSYSQATPATVTGQYYVWDASTDTMHGPAAFMLAAKPGLSSPTMAATGQNTADIGVNTNVGNGPWHWFISTSATPPSEADLIAGTGSVTFGSQTVTATGVQSDSVAGLTAATDYYCHSLQDNQGVYSDIVTSPVETTDAAGADTTPDQFTFTDQTDVETDTLLTSNSITVLGVDVGENINLTITNGEYSINSGAWGTAATTVQLNDQIRVRNTSSSNYATSVNTTLNLNGVSDIFTLTTRAADITPDAFSFTDVNDAALSIEQISDAITVTGVDAGQNVPLTVTGGEYRVNAGAWSSAPTNMQLGDQIELRHTSSGSYSTAVNTTLTLNTVVTDTFTSTTIANSAPVINNQIFYVTDDTEAPTVIGTVQATDDDALTYTITAGNTNNDLAIDTNTGALSVVNTLDRATTASYSLTVQVEDPGTLTDTATITVNVTEQSVGQDDSNIHSSIITSVIDA